MACAVRPIRWLALASATSRTGKRGADDELIRQAVQRARFCEQLALPRMGLDKGTLFLMGLFSLLDAVFRMPMSEVLDRVSLSDEVKQALLDRTGKYADPLVIVESYELGLWEMAGEAAGTIGLDAATLPAIYSECVKWAAEQMPSSKGAVAKAS